MPKQLNPYFQTLTKEQVDKLTTLKKREEWPNDPDMSALKVAVVNKAKTVVLSGTMYTITYGYRRNYPASNETVDSVRLVRADGSFVPMGYIPIKRIMLAD